jgi:hypothetical protein
MFLRRTGAHFAGTCADRHRRPIVHRRDRAYLVGKRSAVAGPCLGTPMPETVSAATPQLSRPLVLIAAAVGILLAATVLLWAHYGTAVFYEMIVAGLAACL